MAVIRMGVATKHTRYDDSKVGLCEIILSSSARGYVF